MHLFLTWLKELDVQSAFLTRPESRHSNEHDQNYNMKHELQAAMSTAAVL